MLRIMEMRRTPNQQAPAMNYARKRAGAFSLVELLVVIAVVAVLAALILTSVVAAKKRARQAHCAHNLRQLGLAAQVFVTDNHVYPLAVNPNYSQGGYVEHQTAWTTALQGILARGDPVHPHSTNGIDKWVCVCPAATRPSNLADSLIYVSYGYNDNGLSTRGTSLGLGGQ